MDFFNNNASGIQAISAMIGVLSIIVLVAIFGRCLVLTRKMADAIQKHGREHPFGEEKAKRRELLTMIKMLRSHLRMLPGDRSKGEAIRDAVLWDPEDILAMQKLSTELGSKSGQIGIKAGTWLRQIAAMVSDIKAIDPQEGVPWDRFNWDGWETARQSTEASLKDLSDAIGETREDDNPSAPDHDLPELSARSARMRRRR